MRQLPVWPSGPLKLLQEEIVRARFYMPCYRRNFVDVESRKTYYLDGGSRFQILLMGLKHTGVE